MANFKVWVDLEARQASLNKLAKSLMTPFQKVVTRVPFATSMAGRAGQTGLGAFGAFGEQISSSPFQTKWRDFTTNFRDKFAKPFSANFPKLKAGPALLAGIAVAVVGLFKALQSGVSHSANAQELS